MRMMTNCPNCGAPITAAQCPYCDTVFWWLTPKPKKNKREVLDTLSRLNATRRKKLEKDADNLKTL